MQATSKDLRSNLHARVQCELGQQAWIAGCTKSHTTVWGASRDLGGKENSNASCNFKNAVCAYKDKMRESYSYTPRLNLAFRFDKTLVQLRAPRNGVPLCRHSTKTCPQRRIHSSRTHTLTHLSKIMSALLLYHFRRIKI